MSRNTKIVLGVVVVVLVVLCLCACASVTIAGWIFRNSSVTVSPPAIEAAASRAVLVDPTQADASGQQIAGFNLPENSTRHSNTAA